MKGESALAVVTDGVNVANVVDAKEPVLEEPEPLLPVPVPEEPELLLPVPEEPEPLLPVPEEPEEPEEPELLLPESEVTGLELATVLNPVFWVTEAGVCCLVLIGLRVSVGEITAGVPDLLLELLDVVAFG